MEILIGFRCPFLSKKGRILGSSNSGRGLYLLNSKPKYQEYTKAETLQEQSKVRFNSYTTAPVEAYSIGYPCRWSDKKSYFLFECADRVANGLFWRQEALGMVTPFSRW